MSNLFVQIMDSRVILAAGSSKGQDQYNIIFKKEVKFNISAESRENLIKLITDEFTQAGVFQKTSKREDIDIIYSRKGILYRIVKVPFMPLDDFEKMMEFEKGDYLSVNPEEYEIRYKIVDKYDESGQIFWDVAVAGIEKEKISTIVKDLDESGFRINYVDILPATYERLFSKIQEKELLIIENDGDFSKICILKNGKVFLYAEFPIDNSEMFANSDYNKLITEIRGYTDYYSSRNFGKSIDALLLLGDYNSNEIREAISEISKIKIYSSRELCNIIVKNLINTQEDCSSDNIIEKHYAAICLMNL